jgi:cell pole-organizing protein PopZ
VPAPVSAPAQAPVAAPAPVAPRIEQAPPPAAFAPPPQPMAAPVQPAAFPSGNMQQPAPFPPPPGSRPGDPAPPWPTRRAEPPESILELTDLAPEAFSRAEPEASPFPPVEPRPMQRAADRIRQAEAETTQPAPRPVPRDLLPRTPTPRATGGDITLEALAREMLQPMLADWIERNLPDIVERLVQTEIRRMTDRDG